MTEILKSTDGNPPPIYDPFCGGGSIPLEAQRLGLEAHGSDLNPVAVLITKALIEIPPKFAGQPPVNPAAKKKMSGKGMWTGARGLADDVRYYGQWMRDRAFEAHWASLPEGEATEGAGGDEATVIAWLWARTVKCPNPACGAQMPLVRSFALSTKAGKEGVGSTRSSTTRRRQFGFEVRTGDGTAPDGTVTQGQPLPRSAEYDPARCTLRAEDRPRRIGIRQILMAVVAEGPGGRIYLERTESSPSPRRRIETCHRLEQPLPDNRTMVFAVQAYGLPYVQRSFHAAATGGADHVQRSGWRGREQAIRDGASVRSCRCYRDLPGFAVDKASDRNTCLVRLGVAKMDRMRGTLRSARRSRWYGTLRRPIRLRTQRGDSEQAAWSRFAEVLEMLPSDRPWLVRAA